MPLARQLDLRPPAAVRLARRVWWREFVAWRHMIVSSTLLNFGQPVMWLTTFGLALGAYISLGRPGSYLQFVAPGLLATTAMNVVTFDALFGTYLKVTEWGTYEAVVATPVAPAAIVAGVFAWQATRALLFGAVFILVMLAFGLVRAPTALLLVPLLLLIGPLFAAPAMAWAASFRRFHRLFYYTELVISPMFFFSGAFFPLGRLPRALRDLIWVMPLSHVVVLSRAFTDGRLGPGLLVDGGYAVAVAAVLAPLAVSRLSRRLTG